MNPLDAAEVKHAMAGVAEILGDYYRELRKNGFSRRDAFTLVRDYHRTLVTPSA